MKVVRVYMSDHTVWDIPAEFVAKDRAAYYAECDSKDLKNKKEKDKKYERVFKEETDFVLSKDGEYNLLDWLENSMNWGDVESVAVEVPTKFGFKEWLQIRNDGLCNGDKEILDL